MAESSWNLAPKFRQVVEQLRPSQLLDLLVESGLVTFEEYRYLRDPSHKTEEERSRILLTEILTKKGLQSFEKFCKLLQAVPGQAFLVGIQITHGWLRQR